MKIREKVLQLALVASVVVLGASAFASSYNGVDYSTSKDIEPGKWFSNFSKVLEYSQANDVPMVVFWGSEGCTHCKKVENQMAKKGFTDWMQESGMVFAFAVDGVTPGSTATAKLYARYGSEFPYVGVYWKSHGVGGKARQGQQDYKNGHFGGRIGESSWSKLRDKIVSYIKDWTPVKGGLFDIDETKDKSAGNRFEVSKETGTVLISLTRPTSAVQKACDDDIMRITYADGTVVSNTLSWAAGDDKMEYPLELDAGKLNAGEAVKLEMLNGTRVVSTTTVTCVGDENSAENPLWLGERTVAAPAKKGLLTATAATPLKFGEWTMDLDVAKQTVANAEGKAYTLVGMLGSLWCHDCANTERNFLSLTDGKDNLFAKWAKEHNVALVSLDLPSVADNDPEGKNSTCLLMKHAATTTLAYEGVYGYYDVSKGGAPQSLTEPMSRSGAGYMSRKGIKATEAATCLSNNLWLAKTNVDKGGYHIYFGNGDVRNEDSNAYRPGVPGFVLLRKDGSVAARFQRFASASPMKFDAEKKEIATANFANYIKRFDEMLAIADATDDQDDASEINNYPSDASIPLTNGTPAGVSGRLCNADQRDSFKIVGMTGAAKQIAYVTGSSDAIVKAQFFIRKADGSVVPVGTEQKNPLPSGVSLTGDITEAGECFVVVSGADITSAAFDAASSNSTFVGYTVTTWTEKLLAQEAAATIAATNGQEFAMQVEANKYYRLVGVDTNVTGFAENFAQTSTTNVYKAISGGEKIVTAAADGDLTYQKWVPGTVRFVPPTAREIKESDAIGVQVKVERTAGASGEVKLQVRVDQEATDCFYDLWPWKPGEPATYKQMPRFTVNDQWEIVTNKDDFATTITYLDGFKTTDDVDTFVIKPNALAFKELQKSYYGDQKIVIRLKVLSGDGVELEGKGADKAAPEEATYVITIKDDAKQQKPGTVYFKEGASIFSKTGPYTVYARKSSSVDISIGRTDPANGVVATAFTKSKGSKMVITGVEDAENPLAGFQPLLARQGWGNRDISDKVITVTNLPAVGKSETITLKPVSPLKVKSSSTKAVKIVSVADDATEFEEREYCFSNLLRYVSCTCPCTLKEPGSGTLSAKKLRGSIPSGLSAKLLTVVSEDGSTTNKVLCFSGYPTKAGTYTAYYQVVENRGTKKKPKNYGGLPVKVVFTVNDPVTAGKSADPAIAAIANPSVASTRTLNDLMVFGPYAETNRLAGKLKLTIPRTGKMSAKYVCNGGTISFSAKGWEPKDPYAGEVSGELTATLTATKKAWTNYTLTVTAETNGVVTASIADPYYAGTELEAWSDGKVWNSKHTAKPWKGQYTVSLMPVGAMVGVNGNVEKPLPGVISESIVGLAPRGPGYLTFKMTSSSAYNAGKMTWGGKLPDGTSVSGTTVLTEELADEEDEGGPDWKPTYAFLPVFTRLTTKVSKSVTTYDRLSLIARIVRDGKDCLRAVTPAESLARGEWEHRVTKPAAAAETMNFTMDVFAFGSFYDPNRNLGDCCEEKGPVAVDQLLDFEKLDWMSSLGFFTPVAIDPIAITVKYTDKKPSKHTIKINGGQENPRNVTLTLTRSTGVLSGSFKFPFSDGAGVTHTVSAKWYGVLLPGWPCACGCGEAPEVLDPEVDPVYLPFISGGYIFSDTIPNGVSTKRGGRIKSSEAGPQ